MEARFQKFRSSQQAKVKLEIALEDFFLPRLPENIRTAYGTYLRQRIRPAVEALVLREDTEKLDALEQLGYLEGLPLDDFLKLAGEGQKNASLVWLLRRKQRVFGFRPRDLSL